MSDYHPEPYWSAVADRIKSRGDHNVIAGDDEPFYRYKRNRFLSMLLSVDFKDKSVLEIGHGPGGNLLEIMKKAPSRLAGADISDAMIALAKENTQNRVELFKTDGTKLPFKDGAFDLVFSATVLQHNSDDKMMRALLAEMCRVSSNEVYLFEKVDSKIVGDDLCFARPVEYYHGLVKEEGFKLNEVSHINIRSSYYVCGASRKLLNKPSRTEGEPLSSLSIWVQKITLPITKILDRIFTSKKDVAKMRFIRKS